MRSIVGDQENLHECVVCDSSLFIYLAWTHPLAGVSEAKVAVHLVVRQMADHAGLFLSSHQRSSNSPGAQI